MIDRTDWMDIDAIINSDFADWRIKEIILERTEWAINNGYLKSTEKGDALKAFNMVKEERRKRREEQKSTRDNSGYYAPMFSWEDNE